MTNITPKTLYIAVIFITFSFNIFANVLDISSLIQNTKEVNSSALQSSSGRTKLTPTPVGIAGDNNRFGRSISIYNDRAVIGAPNMGTTGMAYVYEYNGVKWNLSAVLKPTDNLDISALFGVSVSMDNNRIVVGASQSLNNSGSTSGAVHVYDFNGNEWVETQKLIIDNGWSIDNFGHSVSLVNNRIAIGAYRALGISDSLSGAVYIFDLVTGNWNESQKISLEDGRNNDYFGYSVDLSNNRLIIGAYNDDNTDFNNSGSAYIYDLEKGTWSLTQKLTASSINDNDYFGYSVSLNGDQALIGAYGSDLSNEDAGAAYVFDYNGNTWQQSTLLLPEGNNPSSFGASVELNNNQAIIGAHSHDFDNIDSGATFVFEFSDNQWLQSQVILPHDRESQDYFGQAVSVYNSHLFINAMYDDDNGINSGSVYNYIVENGFWVQDRKIVSNEIIGSPNSSFGISVSYDGNRLVVGSHTDDGKDQNSGAAYIYDLIDNSWVLTQKIKPNIEIADEYFGKSVSLSGDRVLVGAPAGIISDSEGIGSAYIFDLIQGEWTQAQKISAADGQPNNKFGYSVSLFEERALIGAYGPYGRLGSDNGSAYIFDLIENTWIESTKLTAKSNSYSDNFGISVSLNNNRALIGSPRDENDSFNQGAVYVFDLIGGFWEQTQKLFDTTDNFDNESTSFGYTVSLFNDRAAIGAPYDDVFGVFNSHSMGSVYIFDFNGTEWIPDQKLIAQDYGQHDIFGISISLYENKLAVGSSRNRFINDNIGGAYIFDYKDNNWTQILKIKPLNGNRVDYFGVSVSLFEDEVFIGANLDDNASGTNAGAVYLYEAHEMIFMDGFE
ncbi:MAG: hypothetical protein AB8B80_13405 [Marinicellaceae bacterium]